MNAGPGKVAVIGGGLAGLAAAVALADHGWRVELFEARRRLGGRAGSFEDPDSGQEVDHCQHVGMGCCTNLLDFCRRLGIQSAFRQDRVLHFFGPDGRRFPLQAAPLLPAPLHLGPSFLRLGYLSWSERYRVAKALWQLARQAPRADTPDQEPIGSWLRRRGQSERALQRFWSVVLVSALGESLDHASVSAARKVFVDGFLAARDAYVVSTPTVPLSEIYGRPVLEYLAQRGGRVRCGTGVRQLRLGPGDSDGQTPRRLPGPTGPPDTLMPPDTVSPPATLMPPDTLMPSASESGRSPGLRVAGLLTVDGQFETFDAYVLALPWRRVPAVLPPDVLERLPALQGLDRIQSSPITAVHLWLDRQIMTLPHAVLVDRLSQWVFRHQADHYNQVGHQADHYYQVVISASRELAGRDRESVLREVLSDLAAIWPAAAAARVVRWRMVTQQDAVFSVRPGLDALRPEQKTPLGNLFLAGDWTRTGWPATMEGAVRSGYLAAEAVLHSTGQPDARCLVSDLPRGPLSRWLLGDA